MRKTIEMKSTGAIRIETPNGTFYFRLDMYGDVSVSCTGRLIVEPRASNRINIREAP